MQLQVTPTSLRMTADHLADVSGRMKGALESLKNLRSSSGNAWGDDSIGEQFSGGGQGYLAQTEWVDGSVDAKTNLLDYYAQALRQAADTLERQDQQP